MHHIFISVNMMAHFMCLQVKEDFFFPLDNILIEISQHVYCVNTSFDVLEVHFQWDDHWMIVVTAFQTIPWVFTWETWITLPVSSHIVYFLDAHDSFNCSFLKNKKKGRQKGRWIQNTKSYRKKKDEKSQLYPTFPEVETYMTFLW